MSTLIAAGNTIASSSSTTSTYIVCCLAVGALVAFIVLPARIWTSRPRHRQPLFRGRR